MELKEHEECELLEVVDVSQQKQRKSPTLLLLFRDQEVQVDLLNASELRHAALLKAIDKCCAIRGYLFGILFALSMCMANILIKMSPSLDGSNHSAVRYLIQLLVMAFFIRRNRFDFCGPAQQRKLLVFRGVIGCGAVIIGFFSIRYLDVSDVETLTNSCVVITAIFARIFLNEKLTVCHIFALLLNVTGVLFIVRPNFLFGIEENFEKVFHLNISATASSSFHHHHYQQQHLFSNQSLLLVKNASGRHINGKPLQIMDHSNREVVETVVGVVLVMLSATCMSMAQVTIRKLCLGKIHFSVASIFPAYVGLPASVLVSVLLVLTSSSSHNDLSADADILGVQVVYSLIAGLFGTMGIIFLNTALKYEDATKVGMVKMIGVLFSFILQYIMLDIDVDLLGVLGAFFVVSGVLSVMIVKIYEKKFTKSPNCLLKFLSYKF